MKNTTSDVIMICKKHLTEKSLERVNEENLSTKDCIVYYISSYSGIPIEYVEPWMVREYLRNALLDYIDNALKPSSIMERFFELLDHDYDEVGAYISTLRLLRVKTQVRNSFEYINGFSEENTQPVDICGAYHQAKETIWREVVDGE